MVRTVRSIEEEARVKRVAGSGTDVLLADAGLLEALEGDVVGELVAWAADGGRRALVVGLEDRGRVALGLARAGLFVTVVEPDESLHEPVRAAAEEGKFSIRLNFYASEYMKREFSASGFDVAVFFSVLARYNEPAVVLKKAARELRAGGRIFARVRVRPSLEALRKVLAKVPRAAALLDRAGALAERLPVLAALVALPDAGTFLEEFGGIFKVDRLRRYHLAAPFAGWLVARGGGASDALRRALPVFNAADRAVLKAKPAAALATHLLVYGSKELGLGKTFRV